MANVTALTALNMASIPNWSGTTTGLTSNQITVTNGFYTGVYNGSFYTDGTNILGTWTAYTQYTGSQLNWTASGFSLDVYAAQTVINVSGVQNVVQAALVGDDTITGSSSADVLYGFEGNDAIRGNGGGDTIDGGSGVDTAVFSGVLAGYAINNAGGPIIVTDNTFNRDGADTLLNVEQLQFTDKTLVFDLHSSQDLLVYKIYQAAYGRTPDNGGFRYWAGVADSSHTSAIGLADSFLSAAEFTQVYGTNPSNNTYVTGLYGHVLGRAPDQGGLDYWVGLANGGMAKDALLVAFATSAENANLIGSHASATTGYWTT